LRVVARSAASDVPLLRSGSFQRRITVLRGDAIGAVLHDRASITGT